MPNWIYDETTAHSRLMVAYDRYGITIREWSDDTPEDADKRFHVHEGFYSWEAWRKRERSYCGDNSSGNLKNRIVAGAISLMTYFGPDNDSCGEVDTLREYLNGGHTFTC